MSHGLVQLPAAFGPGTVWVRPSAINVIEMRPSVHGQPGPVVDLHIEGRQLLLSAHCTDRDAASQLLTQVLLLASGGES